MFKTCEYVSDGTKYNELAFLLGKFTCKNKQPPHDLCLFDML